MSDPAEPDEGLARERARQAAFLACLQSPADAATLPAREAPAWAAGLRGHPMGLQAHCAHARATAARVLAAHFPTVLAMVGDEALDVLARRLWLSDPPTSGDLGAWGAGLPGLLSEQLELQAWPWLADSARLDWACHLAERSADAPLDTDSLQRLGDTPAEHLGLAFHPSVQVLNSVWPIAALRQAHRWAPGPERDSALAELSPRLHAPAPTESTVPADTVLVWRQGWQAEVAVLAGPEAQWMRWWLSAEARGDAPPTLAAALAQPFAQPLAQPFAQVPEPQTGGFDVTAWLARALSAGWLWRVTAPPG